MAYNFKELNKSTPKKFKYDETIERPFTTLSKLYAEDPKAVHTVRGVWINKKDKYGDRPEVVLDNAILDAPRSTVDMWKKVLDDADAITSINDGECKFVVDKFHSERYFKDIYVFNFI